MRAVVENIKVNTIKDNIHHHDIFRVGMSKLIGKTITVEPSAYPEWFIGGTKGQVWLWHKSWLTIKRNKKKKTTSTTQPPTFTVVGSDVIINNVNFESGVWDTGVTVSDEQVGVLVSYSYS